MRRLTAWLPLPCRRSCMSAAAMSYERPQDAADERLLSSSQPGAGPADPARLTRALADGRLVLTVDPASAVRLASAARSSYPNLVAAIAVAIAGSAASGTWPRLKACSAPRCGQAFYDESGSAAVRHC